VINSEKKPAISSKRPNRSTRKRTTATAQRIAATEPPHLEINALLGQLVQFFDEIICNGDAKFRV